MTSFILKPAIECTEPMRDIIANILSLQWPQINYLRRLESLRNSESNFILIERFHEQDMAIGHAEIKQSVTVNNNDVINCNVKCAILVSVIIESSKRRNGYGRILLNLLELKCLERGYSYAYLWTENATEFYEKLGYTNCEAKVIDVPVFKNVADVSQLENLFTSRVSENGTQLNYVDPSLPKSIWMCRRLYAETLVADVAS